MGFGGCTSLTTVIIPSTIKSVGTNAFKGCNSTLKVYVAKENDLSINFIATGITDVENQVKWNSTGPSST